MSKEARMRPTVPLGHLVVLALIQGVVGFTSLYVFSALLPGIAADPVIGSDDASWIPWTAQAGLLAVFVAWQLAPRLTEHRATVAALALLAVALAGSSIADSVAWLLAPVALAGAGSLAWSVMHALITELALTRGAGGATLVQWLGAVMLTSGALGRWVLVEIGIAHGWRWPVRVLAIAAAVAAAVTWIGCRSVAQSARANVHGVAGTLRYVAFWGSATVGFAGVARSALDSFEPAALHAAGHADAIAPLGLAVPVGGVLAALVLGALRRRRGIAVIGAAAAIVVGAGLDLLGAIADPPWWLALLTAGRLWLEWGSSLLLLSLGAIVAERYGAAGGYARTFAFWRCVASTAAGLAALGLWSQGGWHAIVLFAILAAGLCLVAAVGVVLTALRR